MFWPKLCKQGSVKVSGKLPTHPPHPTPNPCFSLTCDLRAETWVRGGLGGKFPRNVNWSVNRTKSVQGAWRFLFLSHLFKSNGICEKIFIMNRFISKSYSATKNTIDQQHKERGSCSIECFHMTSRRPYWCPKPVPWELNPFLIQTLSFVTINLHICWPREWKHSVNYY